MNCLHDDYELTAEDLSVEEPYNVIHQHFICLGCGSIGERTFRIPIEIEWNGKQTKLVLE
tara:strand:+ start:1093 stop:1272 length:180 start_codon:yes stop_codon:yes gene_type:complete